MILAVTHTSHCMASGFDFWSFVWDWKRDFERTASLRIATYQPPHGAAEELIYLVCRIQERWSVAERRGCRHASERRTTGQRGHASRGLFERFTCVKIKASRAYNLGLQNRELKRSIGGTSEALVQDAVAWERTSVEKDYPFDGGPGCKGRSPQAPWKDDGHYAKRGVCTLPAHSS